MSVPFSAALVLVYGAVFISPGDPLEEYEFISGLSRKGLHSQVVREATRFLDEHPGHAKLALVRYHLGGALFETDQTASTRRARDQYAQLARLRGFEFAAESALRAGQCELRLDAPAAAAPYFEAVRASAAEYLHLSATRLLGESLFEQGNFAAARVHFAQVASKGEPELALDASHALAWCEFRLAEYASCIATAERTLKRFAKDPLADELRFLRAESLFEAGRAAEALEGYLEVGGGAFREASLRGAAFAAAALDDHARAASAFDLLLTETPSTRFREEALVHRGIHLLALNQPAEARRSLQAAKPTGEGLYWLGMAVDATGQSEAALEILGEAASLVPQNETKLRERIQLARAELYSKLGREEEATRAFETAGSDYALHAAAVARLNAGEPAEAIRLASSIAGRAGPFQLEAQFVLGEGHFAQGSFGLAEEAFEAVGLHSKADPLKVRAASRIAWCHYLAGNHAGAAGAFGRVVSNYPQSEEAEEALFMEARSREDAGESPVAREGYGRYLGKYSAGVRRDEATLRLAELEPDELALPRLEQLVAQCSDESVTRQAQSRLAERYAARAEYARAVTHYRALLAEARDDEARYGLGWCLYSSGNLGEAQIALEPLCVEASVPAELRVAALELSVWSARGAGSLDEACAAFDALLVACKDEPRCLKTMRVLLEGLTEAGRETQALRVCDSFLRQAKRPEVVLDLCVERGHLSLATQKVDDAQRILQAALERDPQHAGLLELAFFVGETRYREGSKQEAVKLFELASASSEPLIRARSHYMAGFAQLEDGANDAAIVSFKHVVAEPAEAGLLGEALYLLGEAYYRAGRTTEAIEVLTRHRKDAAAHTTASKALFRLGLAHAQVEHWAEAGKSLSELVSSYPEFPSLAEAELWRGRSAAALDKPRAARQSFERVLALDKGVLSARARLALGDLQQAAGQLDAALSEYLKVAVLYAQDEEVSEALFKAGSLLEQQGEVAQASKQFEEIVKEHGKSSFASRAQQRLNRIRQENAE